MVYTTLQIIARTREKGMPMRDLGPITGYDPKSIFFQVQQLENLGLVYVFSSPLIAVYLILPTG